MIHASPLKKQKSSFAYAALIVMLVFNFAAKAQTITIGTGTTSGTLYGPVYSIGNTGSRAERIASIYPASMLTGINNGDIINSFEYNRSTATQSYTAGTSLKIYIKNISTTDWGSGSLDFSTAISGATLVYDGDPATIIGNTIGWKQFVFSTPYLFNTSNGNNLAIIYDYYQPTGAGTGTTINWLTDNTNFVTNSTKYSSNSSSPAVSPTAMATASAIHAQIKINYSVAPACTTPPNAGSIQSTKQWYCGGQTYSMSLIGNTFGAGQSYQWQESTDNVNWTPIVSATNTNYSTSQNVATKYYRVIATCSGISDTTDAYAIFAYPSALTGNYTINKNLPKSLTNFISVNDAVGVLNCMGVSGSVNIRLSSDVYNEQVLLTAITGTSATKYVRFVGNNSTIKFLGTVSADRYVIRLNNADYIHLDSLTIEADETGTYGYAVHLLDGSSNNKITNCTIKASTTTTSTNFAGISFSGSTSSATTAGLGYNNNVIEKNTIIGGYYSIIIYGTSANSVGSKGNIIRNNVIRDAYQYTVYTLGCDSTHIVGNDMYRLDRTNGIAFYGVYASTNSSRSIIEKNKIHNPFGSGTGTTSVYGIYVNATDAKKEEFIVRNNILYNLFGTSSSRFGLYNQGSDSICYYNNTVIFDDPVASSAVINGFISGSTAATGIQLLNNIFYINTPGSGNRIAEYWTEVATTFTSNHNGYYISNAGAGINAIGFYNATNYSFSDWQLSGRGANSVSADPGFVVGLSGNHVPSSGSYNNTALSLSKVTEDFTGALRSVTPDMGAYEFSANTEDVNLNAIDLKNICVGTQPVFVRFTNAGVSTLNTLQINWTLNGVNQTPFSFTGPLLSGEDTIISIGTFNVIKDVAYSIVAWSLNPNGTADLNNTNDTAKSKSFRSGLDGLYTIGGPAADFQSLVFAAQELSDRGVCGPVTFNMDPSVGPYIGQVAFQNIPGTSLINTIIFNGNGSIVKASPTLTDKRSVILIEATDYLTLDSINVVADSSTYGWGIHLYSGSDYNTIKNSTVTVVNTATTTNFSGIVLSGSLTSATTDGLGSYNLIENNRVKGGYYGIAINGITNNLGSLYNRVIDNSVQDYYAYGVYINSSDSALVARNDISRPNRTNSTTTAGIYVSGNSMSVVVERNRIHDVFAAMPTSVSSNYGIYQTANDVVPSRPLIVRNNAIYNMQSNGTLYGIYNTSSNNALYYNNTVHIDDVNATTSSAGYAFYQTTEASGIELKNNIFYINRAGTGPRAAVRFNTTTSTIASNYNNLYATNIGTGTNALGFYGTTDHATLTSWQGTTNDINSYDVAPLLVAPNVGDVTPNAFSLDGTGIPSPWVTDDINGNFRNSPPDIGAVEFTITLDDAGITSIDSPSLFCPGQQVVKATIKNFGVSTISTVKVNWQVNGVNQSVYNFAGSLASGEDTSIVLGTINALSAVNYTIKAWTSLPNNIVDNVNTNDTTTKQNIRTSLYGVNTIGGPSANFQSINAAVQAMNLYGICDTVIFEVDSAAGPYNEQILISNFDGTSLDKQVIFNGNGAVINFEPTVSASRYVFRIENTDYITINRFNIKSINGTYGWGVHLTSGSDYNTISNNNIQLSQTSTTSANFVGIILSGSNTTAASGGLYNHNKITSNIVDGGYHGILIYGTSGTSTVPLTKGNIINKNKVFNNYAQGIYTAYQQHIEISNNELSRPTRATSTSYYGIEATGVTAGLKINNNRIHNLFGGIQSSTSTSYSIYITSSDHVGGKGIVANNLIYNINGGGIIYGIYNSGSDSIKYLFNSISLEDKIAGKTQATYGFYQTTEAKGLEYLNNSILIDRTTTGNQVAMYFSTNTTIPVSNYNNFYTPNGNVAYHTALRENLSDWQAVNTSNPYDLNSTFSNPLYNGVTNLIPQAASPLVNTGTPNTGVLNDIDGTVRSVTSPYKGAFEKSGDFRGPYYIVNPISNTISTTNLTVNGVVSISDVSGVDVSANNRPRIYYKLTSHNNKFIDNTSASNGWKYTTALNASSPFNFVIDYSKLFGGAVSTNDEIEYFFAAQDLLGYVSTSHGTFKKSPSSISAIDSNQFELVGSVLKYRIATLINDDTLYVGNAHTLKSLTTSTGLFKYLNDNILTGNLTVIVTSDLSEDGTHGLNDLSESGIGNYSIRIIPQTQTVYNIQGAYTGGLIRLNGADRVTIDGSINNTGYYFNISNTSTASNIAAIQFIGLGTDTTGASYNTIKGSIISTGASLGNAIGIHIGGPSIPYDAVRGNHNNRIINNKIFKGSVGIYNSGESGGLSDSLLIRGNIIGAEDGAVAADNIRLYGIALEYNKNAIVENNLVQNIRNASAQQSWGIAVYGNFNNGIISKNKIQNIVGGAGSFGGRGLEINSGTSQSNIRITNNFIAGVSGSGSANLNSTANVGLYINGTSDIKIYNNSIHLSGSISRTTSSPDTSAAVYVRGNAYQLDVLNNTISNTMNNTTDTSLAYAFISSVNDTAFTNLDYNNYFVGDATQNPQGILSRIRGVSYNTLSDIKTATNANTNSISISPNFVSSINLHAQGSALYQKGQVIAGLVDDIDGDLRGNPPCIGADEFMAPNNDIVNIGFSYPNSTTAICGTTVDSIQVIVFNQGLQAQTGFEVKAYITGAINDTLTTIYNGNLLPTQKDTVTLGYYNSALATGNISIRSILTLITDVGRENDTSDLSAKVLATPSVPNVLPFTAACVGNSTKIIATTNVGDTKWYSQALGGSPIKLGDTLTTSVLTKPTIYYAEASTSSVQTQYTGMKAKLSAATSGAGTTNFGIVFDVLAPFTLESVVVYPVASTAGLSGTVTIDVVDGSNTVVHTKVVNVVGNPSASVTPQRVFLNFNMLPGTNYKLRPGTRGAGITGLMFEPSSGAPAGNYGYPYLVPGLLSIKTSTLTAPPTNTARNDLYYYFYDWAIRTGQEGCVSARVPVLVTPAPLPSGSIVAQASPYQGVYNAGTLASPDAACAGDTITYTLTAPTGYNLSDFGTTWTVINPQVKTTTGQTPVGNVSINGLTVRYVAAAGDEDSTLVFTASIKSLSSSACDTPLARYIKIEKTPLVNLGADKTVCVGTTVVLDAGNVGASYLWSTGETTQTITINTTGTYSVKVTNAGSCYSEDTITVNYIALPIVNLGPDQTACIGTSITLDAGNAGSTYLWSTGETTQSIQPTVTGIYTVTVTANGGCSTKDTISITFNPLPVVNLGADLNICLSDTVTLDAGNAGSTYLWSTGETTRTIRVNLAGTYSVTVTNANACVNTDAIVVTNKATPISDFSIAAAAGTSITFQAAATVGLTYSWNFGDPTSPNNTSQLQAPVHVFSSAGTYTVTLTVTAVSTGCKSTTTEQVTITGVGSDLVEFFKLGSAPNPFVAETKISYTLPNDATNVSVEVYDMIGRKVAGIVNNEYQTAGNYVFNYKNEDLQTSGGVYMLRLVVDGKIAYIRIVDASKR